MKSTFSALPFVLALGLLAGCGRDGDTADPIAADPASEPVTAALVGSWTHAFEDEPEGSAVDWYRPTLSRDWTEAWFRMRFDLYQDGTAQYMWLSPVDAHEMRPGTWQFDPKDDRIVRIYDQQGVLLERVSFRIVGLEDDLLRVEPLGAR